MTAQERIFQLLRQQRELTRQEIAASLALSMPTTLQHVTELAQMGLIEECGTAESVNGRKAKKVRLCPQAGFTAGINIALHQVEFVVIDLLGKLQRSHTVPLVFRDETDWYWQLQNALLAFLQEEENILGVGLSFPGTIDSQANEVVHSHIFGLHHMGLDRFQKIISYPLAAGSDAHCACLAERETGRDSFVYISLNESVGGAIILNHQLLMGDTFQAGEIGHMLLIPGGRPCCCGKSGCADAYLSPTALKMDGWAVYLENLAILLTNLRMVFNMDLVVGGETGAQMDAHWDALCAKAAQYDRFSGSADYISPCRQREYTCAIGAAVLALERFGNRIFSRVRKRIFAPRIFDGIEVW